jgi:renalase
VTVASTIGASTMGANTMSGRKPSVAIIGAGMAGLSCANVLADSGWTVTLFDKGRRPGGRMASRKIETAHGPATFDFGAQYFTVRDAGFAAEVARWEEAGMAARWPEACP